MIIAITRYARTSAVMCKKELKGRGRYLNPPSLRFFSSLFSCFFPSYIYTALRECVRSKTIAIMADVASICVVHVRCYNIKCGLVSGGCF